MNERTAEIVLDCLEFFSLSDEETVDPDAAVKMLEMVAASLQRLERTDQRVLLEVAARRAVASAGAEVRQFYQSLPEYLGLEP